MILKIKDRIRSMIAKGQFLGKLTVKGQSLGKISRGFKAIAGVGLVVLAFGLFSFYKPARTLADSAYTWVQNAWTGGADTSSFPSHPGNKTGWDKYYSKDSTISTNSGISLTSPSSAITDNTTAAFSAGTQQNTSAPSGQNKAILLKPLGATAANGWECVEGRVSGGVCVSAWYNGRAGTAMAGKQVYYQDVSGTRQWQTSYTSCTGPQCATGLDPNYSGSYALVASNSVDFSLYPARDACKALGGRLPYMNELLELYAGKASYGNNFQSLYYWSATEYNSNLARTVDMSYGIADIAYKTNNYYVRCVR